MTISGGQILHKAGYPRITFPRIQKNGSPPCGNFCPPFFFYRNFSPLGKGHQKTHFNKGTE